MDKNWLKSIVHISKVRNKRTKKAFLIKECFLSSRVCYFANFEQIYS